MDQQPVIADEKQSTVATTQQGNCKISVPELAGNKISTAVLASTKGHPRDSLPKWRWIGTITLLCFCNYVAGYDVSNVANIQAPVYEALGHIELLPWISLSFSLGSISVTPLVRKLVDMFNLKVLMICFVAMFVISSAISGSAREVYVVVIGRYMTGIGNAGAYQLVLTYVSLFTDTREATRLNGFLGLWWAFGLISGPLISGAFAENEHATWRWAFYLNVPILGTLLPLFWFVLPSHTVRPGLSLHAKLAEIDWVGAALHLATCVLLAVALTLPGTEWQWSSAGTITTWALLAIVFIAYVLQQRFTFLAKPERCIFPARILARRTPALAVLATGCAATTYAVTLYYPPLFYAFTRGYTSIISAVHMLPFICVFITGTVLAGALLPYIQLYAAFYVLAGSLILTGSALMTTIDTNTSDSHILGYQALIGFGVGLILNHSFSVMNATLSSSQERLEAAALVNMAQMGFVCLALALSGCLYQNLGIHYLRSAIGDFNFTDEDVRSALAGVASQVFASADKKVSQLVVVAVTNVISRIFYMLVATGGVCFLAGLAMPWEKLDFKNTAQSGDIEQGTR